MERSRTRLTEITARLADELHPIRWADIGQLLEKAKGIIDLRDPEVVAELCAFASTALIRKAMGAKDEEGYPLFPSIVVPRKDGKKKVRMYMSERRMKAVHYSQFGSECHRNAVYWMRKENATVKRSCNRYGGTPLLPWPEAGIG